MNDLEQINKEAKKLDAFCDFIYTLDSTNAILSIRYKKGNELYIETEDRVIHLRERTPEKLYTRAIFEVLHNI